MALPKHYKLIACEIMFREICYCAAKSRNIVDIQFMPKGLHDLGETKMKAELQSVIGQVDTTKYDAILLGYGLCNNGIRGLHAGLTMVIPRAHDCITLLVGSKEKYIDYFEKNPGTFFKSPGWVERDVSPNDSEQSVTSQLGMNKTYQEYLEKYGEENARYLMEALGDWLKNYKKLTYIDTQIGDFSEYKELTRSQAKEKGWEYEELAGNVNILARLLNGEWDDRDFLVLPPHKQIQAVYDREEIIKYE
ncbi:MAG TPA: hypothetical protein DDW65_24270 [Firmicutes bacterium]|nr:hypothetical protein [Bacillota bacterium]